MVSLTDIESSNARISTVLPPGLVAVFVGGTNGVGETTLRRFAAHARQPRAYSLGRSQEAGDRITAERKTLDPEGVSIQRTSLNVSVDWRGLDSVIVTFKDDVDVSFCYSIVPSSEYRTLTLIRYQ